jgi:ribonuclease HII
MRRPNFAFEQTSLGPVAGIDEAGRGPWAGPVIAAAVIFQAMPPPKLMRQVDDSKKLSAAARAAVFDWLPAYGAIALGRASVEEIDALNILGATMLAMQRAVDGLPFVPGLALIDGNRAPQLACPARCIVGGDGLALSIAAASIVAKVTRDREMAVLAQRHPGYGWERNMGYGTAEHRRGIERLGINPQHRRTFRPISELLTTTC